MRDGFIDIVFKFLIDSGLLIEVADKEVAVREWVVRSYIEKEMSTSEIASVLGISATTVKNSLKILRIKARDVGGGISFSRALYDAGYSSDDSFFRKHAYCKKKEMARILGVSYSSIRYNYDLWKRKV